MLFYNLLEAILKMTNQVDYRSLPEQVNQQIMKDCNADWKSYFKSLKEYVKHKDKYHGKPKISKTKKSKSIHEGGIT